jgi:glycosyltransferase involved in cell wall biosynthesis
MNRSPPAQLEVDFAFDAVGDYVGEGGIRRIGFHSIAAATRPRKALVRLLRGARCETVIVREDGLAHSGGQAVILVLVGLMPARRWLCVRPGRERQLGRAGFLGRALCRLPAALAKELWHTLRLLGALRAAARVEYRLPRSAEHVKAAVYLRIEPSVRWCGTFVGGAATHTTGVISGLLANGVDVSVIAPERFAGVDRARFMAVAPRRALHFVPAASHADYSQAIVAAGTPIHADFFYQRYTLGGSAGLELARRLHKPLVLEFNGSEIWVEQQWGRGRVRMERSLSALERRNLSDASLIVVVSEALKDQLVKGGVAAERILVDPNGVDVDGLAPYRERSASEWRERIGRPQAPTIGFIGTFGRWHGVELLPDLIAATRGAEWIVIGAGGPLYGRVSAEIRRRGGHERVLLAGIQPHERALELLSACDVCVSPHVPNLDGSRFFGSPTKLFEYMGLGKAIVASDLEQIGEVIEHERNGLLHPPGDIETAAAAIERLLNDSELRGRVAAAALQDARERYSWAAHVRRILDALTTQRPAPRQ